MSDGGTTIVVLRKLSLEILTKWVLAFFHLQPWHHRPSGRLLLAEASLSVSPGVSFHCAHCLTQNSFRNWEKAKGGFKGIWRGSLNISTSPGLITYCGIGPINYFKCHPTTRLPGLRQGDLHFQMVKITLNILQVVQAFIIAICLRPFSFLFSLHLDRAAYLSLWGKFSQISCSHARPAESTLVQTVLSVW